MTKATIQDMAGVESHPEAVARELEPQLWTVQQPWFEERIAARSRVAGIGVGMTADYGAAQRLYVRRGYVPDGRGLMTGGRPVAFGESVPVDDDLVLYFTRELTP